MQSFTLSMRRHRRALVTLLVGGIVAVITLSVTATEPDAAVAELFAKPVVQKPASEPATPRSVRVNPDVPSDDAGEAISLDEATHVSLRDIPPSEKPVQDAPKRFHMQGDESAQTRDSDAARALFPTEPASLVSDMPRGPLSRAPGDSVRIFDGIDSTQTNWIPPDMQMAVGPQYVVEVANSGFSVYTKTGHEMRGYRTFNDLLASKLPTGWAGFLFDPRVTYSADEQRYVMLVLGRDDANQEAYFWLAISDSSDPRDGWCLRRQRVTQINATTTGWLDFAGLGTDSFGIYITGNNIRWDGVRHGAAIHTYPVDTISDCSSGGGWKFTNIQWPSGGDADSLQPAQAHSVNGDGETFFVGTRPISGNDVILARVSGNRASSPTLTRAEIDIPAYNAIQSNVNQPGTTVDLDGGKSKAISAIYANRRVFFSLTTDVLNDGSASGWLNVKLNTDANTKDWHHLLWSGEDRYLFYPALTLDGSTANGNIAVFGSWTHATDTAASAVYKIYENHTVDNTGRFQTPVLGTGAYNVPDSNGRNRWGDYSGASYDWTCGHAWGVSQSATGNAAWKTSIIARKFDNEGDCPQLFVTSPAEDDVLNSGDVVDITWDRAFLPAGDELLVFLETGGLPTYIAQGLATTATSLSWTVEERPSENARIIVGSWDGSRYTALHYSDEFTILDRSAPTPDPLVFATPPVADGTQAIRMSAVAVDGSGDDVDYRFFFNSTPTGGSGGSGTLWQEEGEYVDAALLINHEYCYVAKARDEELNTTDETPVRCVYTLSNEPLAAAFSDINDRGISVNWRANSNAIYTEFQAQNTTTGEGSGWVNALTWRSAGLSSGQTYAFRVRSRNGDGIASDWVELGTATTDTVDTDGDGVVDSLDNCALTSNPMQRDTDGDGLGNICDADLSQDCVVNVIDLGLLRARFFSADPDADLNGDGVVNVQDLGLMRLQFFSAPGPSGVSNLCTP